MTDGARSASVTRLQDAPSLRQGRPSTDPGPPLGPRLDPADSATVVDLPVTLIDAIEEVICSAGSSAARSEAIYRLVCEIDETTRWMLGHDGATELVSLRHLVTAAAVHRHRMVD